ncbi:concanavalin A-like lectin/glucanase domain-containing protein [Cadophora sp. MPI-SDFR-AT-0126]|nr:concanavalin A-like lectin/glucanase domain-containing protein [Leotiomycetes sp. MPI-SDFR-AT-0126]
MISITFSILVLLVPGLAAQNATLCGRYDRVTGSLSPYTFASNQWGDDGSGSQCIKIAADETVFNATWKWSKNPDSVHSFPNIKLNSNLLPRKLSNLSSLNVAASWTMAPVSTSKSLEEVNAAANVIIDMFLDPSPVSANSTTLPKYEVMIWLSEVGGKKPIGFSSSIKNPPKYKLNNTSFTLYSGSNSNGQHVFGWLASPNMTSFKGDISPLLHYLWRHKLIDDANYLGIVQFGTETFHSTSDVVFSAHNYNLSIAAGMPSPNASPAATNVPNSCLGIISVSLILAVLI